jgi:glycosyltransferase involved in cell wall biosynthesis
MSPRLAVAQLGREPGGSQNLWVHALTDPRFSGVEKHVLVPAGGGTKLSAEERRAAGITLHEFGGSAGRLAQRAAKTLGLDRDPLARALGAVDPDVVWFNLAGIGEIGWIDAAAAHCRARHLPYWLIVQHVHEEFFFASDAHETRARDVARGAARVLTVSARNRASLAVAFAERMPNLEAAVNGVPRPFLDAGALIAAQSPPRTEGNARFISPARFDPAFKGQHLLLEAFAGAEWRGRDWHLSLVGGGPHMDLIRRLVGFFGLPAARVTLTPHTNDMLGAFAGADVIVMPSLSEGSPFALAEGMACGRPAVGTPVGGIDELIRDGETGWLAHSTEPDDVAAALDRCWHDRAEWPLFGRSARERAARAYDLEPAHQVLLANLLSDARRR